MQINLDVMLTKALIVFSSILLTNVLSAVAQTTESIALESGWNLISVPFKAFTLVSSTCDFSKKHFYHYDSAAKNWEIVTEVRNLEGGKGYWINSVEKCEIKIIGNEQVVSIDIRLATGWNQIGSTTTTTTFQSIKAGCTNIENVFSYDAFSDSWKALNSNENLEKYKGYFIKAVDCPSLVSVSISGGAYTSLTTVTLSLSCTDPASCLEMQFSNDGSTFSTPEPYSVTKTWTLTTGDGVKTVYVKVKDSRSKTTIATDTITLDTTPPTISNGQPTGTINTSSTTISVQTNEAAACKYSTTAGVAYDLMTTAFSTTGGTSHSKPLSGLTNSVNNYYIKCKDTAGNKNTNDYVITFSVSTPVCADFAIIDLYPPTNVGETVKVRPLLVSWEGISSVKVLQYQHPRPLSPPFTEDKWTLLGTITRYPIYECVETREDCSTSCDEFGNCDEDCETGCARYSNKIVGYEFSSPDRVCIRTYESGRCVEYAPAVPWRTPEYPGRYYLGMEIYDASGKKVDGWDTVNNKSCTDLVRVQAYRDQTCKEDRLVYPRNVIALVSGNDVLVQWQVANSNGQGNDNAEAWKSTQAGFTSDSSKRVVSRLKSGATSAHDAKIPGDRTYFYKVSAFGKGGEVPASSDQASVQYKRKNCNLDSSPTDASDLSVSGTTFNWEYLSAPGIGVGGWYIKRSDGVRFHVDVTETTTKSCDNYVQCASWTMPTAIPGTYKVQAYGGCGGLLGRESNSVTVTGSTSGSLPTGAPSGISATQLTDSIGISWIDTASNEIGFHVYRSNEPLDLIKSTKLLEGTSSYDQYAYFPDLPVGNHYFAIKVKNNCGEGWSNYVSVDIK